MKSKIMLIGFCMLLFLITGCGLYDSIVNTPSAFVEDNAKEFCENKGFDGWKWAARFEKENLSFYCVNNTLHNNIEYYYLGVKNKNG